MHRADVHKGANILKYIHSLSNMHTVPEMKGKKKKDMGKY